MKKEWSEIVHEALMFFFGATVVSFVFGEEVAPYFAGIAVLLLFLELWLKKQHK